MQIAVRTNGGAGFTVLSPRQQLTPAPYAIFAEGANAAGLSGTVPPANLGGTYGAPLNLTNADNNFDGNGAGLTGLNASQLTSGIVPVTALSNAWRIGGNAGANPTNGNFIGTTDNQPLELRVNGLRASRFEPTRNDANHSNLVNVVNGCLANSIGSGVYGATICGGGAVNFLGSFGGNTVIADFGTVCGGLGNVAGGSEYYLSTETVGYSTVCGGISNSATGTGSFVGGGGIGTSGIFGPNIASGDGSVVAGGVANTASGGAYAYTTVGGGYGNTASVSYATVAGGGANTAAGNDSTVGGGVRNIAGNEMATVAGGYQNTASNLASTVSGGYENNATPSYGFATIGGGNQNNATGDYTTVAGGDQNTASGDHALVAGGYNNTAGGNYAVVGGGYQNTANGGGAVVPGGFANSAKGACSFAAGIGARASHDDCFVWSDGTFDPFSSTGTNQFVVYASGGMAVGTNNPQAQLHVASNGGSSFPQAQLDQQNKSDYSRLRFTVGGNANKRWDLGATETNFVIYSGSIGANMIYLDHTGLTVNGAFVSSSDRNVKAGFESVDAKDVLDKLAEIPITRWHYTNDPTVNHVGPMAQDFHSAFNLGLDDKHIATVDEEGVALAAIQALNRKVEDLKNELTRRDAENADLKARLNRLERLSAYAPSNRP